MVILLYWKYRAPYKSARIGSAKKLFMFLLLFLSILVLSVSFTEFIRMHNMSGNGFDLAHAYLMKYGLFLITIPFFWILLLALNQLHARLIAMMCYGAILIGFAGLYYFGVNHPSCLHEGDICVYAESRAGAISMLILITFFFLKEAYKHSRSILIVKG